jgi:hypothetical protein
MESLRSDSSSWRVWLIRALSLNAIAAGAALICFMIMFAILSGSAWAGLSFLIALPSMVLEGDGWGIWMLSPLYLLPFHLFIRRR